MPNEAFKRLICLGCGFLYDEAEGLPEHGCRREPGGGTSPTTGAAPIAARPSTNSRWS